MARRDDEMKFPISAPDHTTVSRRAVGLTLRKSVPKGPLHVLIDSTSLEVFGAGQWLEAKHGAKSRRTWRKLHLAVDADSGMIVAQVLTDQHTDDPSQVRPLASCRRTTIVAGCCSASSRMTKATRCTCATKGRNISWCLHLPVQAKVSAWSSPRCCAGMSRYWSTTSRARTGT